MNRLPCVCCEEGNPKSHTICANCESIVELRNEVYDAMLEIVKLNNLIYLDQRSESLESLEKQVLCVYDSLMNIRVDSEQFKNELIY